ncbi:hypothetical protein C8J56DRAFT_1048121 [Mycena floridula]|nr:hypothetical protein C8J56DRAFT_1048121 [Mycena floridula]
MGISSLPVMRSLTTVQIKAAMIIVGPQHDLSVITSVTALSLEQITFIELDSLMYHSQFRRMQICAGSDVAWLMPRARVGEVRFIKLVASAADAAVRYLHFIGKDLLCLDLNFFDAGESLVSEGFNRMHTVFYIFQSVDIYNLFDSPSSPEAFGNLHGSFIVWLISVA